MKKRILAALIAFMLIMTIPGSIALATDINDILGILGKDAKPAPTGSRVLMAGMDGDAAILEGGPYDRFDIDSVTFVDTLADAPHVAWDVSEAGDGSVLAWVEEVDDDDHLYIGAEGGVIAGESCDYLFYGIKAKFISFGGNFDTSGTTSMRYMFHFCDVLEDIDLNSLDTSSVTDMTNMFYFAGPLTNMNMQGMDFSSVVTFENMFSNSTVEKLDMSGISAPSVQSTHYMFYNCENLTTLDLTGFTTGDELEIMDSMFYGCASLRSVDLSGFDTSEVNDMDSMFKGCAALTDVDLSGFDTSECTSMYCMFAGCESLTELDLSSFSSDSLTFATDMFNGCARLADIDVTGRFVIDFYVSSLFDGCSKLPGSVKKAIWPEYAGSSSGGSSSGSSSGSTSAYSFTAPNLSNLTQLSSGSSGDSVRKLQQRLIDLGYLPQGEADGKYGGKTATAVHIYMAINGLYDGASLHEPGSCVATVDMQKHLYSNSCYYSEPAYAIRIPDRANMQYENLSGDKLKFRIHLENISRTRTVVAFEIYCYATDVWGEEIYGTSVYYDTTEKRVTAGTRVYSDYIVIPDRSRICNLYVGVHKIRYSDGEIVEIPNVDYDYWTFN